MIVEAVARDKPYNRIPHNRITVKSHNLKTLEYYVEH